MPLSTITRRRLHEVHPRERESAFIAKGLASTRHLLLAHIIPISRCNLVCTYCSEFDHFSKPVPVEEMYGYLDPLASLGTSIINQ
jgi:MoaA/NifB/PqqE/SkfB family radical SAM enzyme